MAQCQGRPNPKTQQSRLPHREGLLPYISFGVLQETSQEDHHEVNLVRCKLLPPPPSIPVQLKRLPLRC